MSRAYFLFLPILALLLNGCNPTKQLVRQHPAIQYLPEDFRNVYFGMPLTEFRDARPEAEQFVQPMSFRSVYQESLPQSKYQYASYYIDKEPQAVLYEVILTYQNEAGRDAEATKLLGEPNYDGTEWRFQTEEGFLLWCWTYQTKLIYAAVLPGTEWEEELEAGG